MGEVVVSSEGGMDTRKETEKDGSSEVVQWEKFLPRTVLTVLLVEADDSTRQIIHALLRKCSYRVAAVSDGLMAWETLKGQPHNIDLVLTEVELPSISGFSLLNLVMEHDICKNIPVIMMSSHDSISMVLKCMLKGAADFLIKPVRRNELRNLWQHVWRRYCLLGGHIPENLPTVNLEAEASSGNNTASNHSSDHPSSSQKNKGSEKVSDAHGLSELNCRSASYICNADMEKHDESIKLEEESMMPESKTRGAFDELMSSDKLNRSGTDIVRYDNVLRLEADYACAKTMSQGEREGPKNDRINANIVNGIHGCSDELTEPSSGAIDLIGTFDTHHKFPEKLSTLNDGMDKFHFSPQLELCLRKSFHRTSNDQGQEERHTLNHSTASAFSWYNNRKTVPTPTSNSIKLKDGASKSGDQLSNQLSENVVGSSQPFATSSKSQENMKSPVMGQSEQAFPRPHLGFFPVPGMRLDNLSAGYGNVFPSIVYTQSSLPPARSPKSTSQQEHCPFPASDSAHSNPNVHESEQGYGQSGEITPNSVDQTVSGKKKVEIMEELRHGSPTGCQSPNSSLCNGLAKDNSVTYGDVCCRIEGNAFSAKVIEKGTAPQDLNEGTHFVHDVFNGTSSHRSSEREAALIKFRLKRKERCFEKKVRYQSRKSLAEKRPRVKGQFVRQVKNDTKFANVGSCP